MCCAISRSGLVANIEFIADGECHVCVQARFASGASNASAQAFRELLESSPSQVFASDKSFYDAFGPANFIAISSQASSQAEAPTTSNSNAAPPEGDCHMNGQTDMQNLLAGNAAFCHLQRFFFETSDCFQSKSGPNDNSSQA